MKRFWNGHRVGNIGLYKKNKERDFKREELRFLNMLWLSQLTSERPFDEGIRGASSSTIDIESPTCFLFMTFILRIWKWEYILYDDAVIILFTGFGFTIMPLQLHIPRPFLTIPRGVQRYYTGAMIITCGP